MLAVLAMLLSIVAVAISFTALLMVVRQLAPQRAIVAQAPSDAPPASSDGAPQPSARYRSPIPQPGETFTAPLPPARLPSGDSSSVGSTASPIPPPDQAPAQAPDGPIPWSHAGRYIGQTVTVEGRVANASKYRGRVCFLNFTQDWQGQFYVVVFSEAFEDFPESPEKYLLGKTIRVTGPVQTYDGRPQIRVYRDDQVEVLPQPVQPPAEIRPGMR